MGAPRSEHRSREGIHPLRLALALSLPLLGLLPSLALGQGYTYEKSKDPLVIGVKAVLGAARAGEGNRVDQALETLRPALVEIEEGLGLELGPRVEAARKSGDSRDLARALTEVVYHQLRRQLEQTRKGKLLPSRVARLRLQAALHYYREILSFTVRLGDSSTGTRHHAAVLAAFQVMQGALGSEGLFGVGSRAPKPASFTRAAGAALRSLRAAFPEFAAPRPGELGADRATSPPAPPRDGRG